MSNPTIEAYKKFSVIDHPVQNPDNSKIYLADALKTANGHIQNALSVSDAELKELGISKQNFAALVQGVLLSPETARQVKDFPNLDEAEKLGLPITDKDRDQLAQVEMSDCIFKGLASGEPKVTELLGETLTNAKAQVAAYLKDRKAGKETPAMDAQLAAGTEFLAKQCVANEGGLSIQQGLLLTGLSGMNNALKRSASAAAQKVQQEMGDTLRYTDQVNRQLADYIRAVDERVKRGEASNYGLGPVIVSQLYSKDMMDNSRLQEGIAQQRMDEMAQQLAQSKGISPEEAKAEIDKLPELAQLNRYPRGLSARQRYLVKTKQLDERSQKYYRDNSRLIDEFADMVTNRPRNMEGKDDAAKEQEQKRQEHNRRMWQDRRYRLEQTMDGVEQSAEPQITDPSEKAEYQMELEDEMELVGEKPARTVREMLEDAKKQVQQTAQQQKQAAEDLFRAHEAEVPEGVAVSKEAATAVMMLTLHPNGMGNEVTGDQKQAAQTVIQDALTAYRNGNREKLAALITASAKSMTDTVLYDGAPLTPEKIALMRTSLAPISALLRKDRQLEMMLEESSLSTEGVEAIHACGRLVEHYDKAMTARSCMLEGKTPEGKRLSAGARKEMAANIKAYAEDRQEFFRLQAEKQVQEEHKREFRPDSLHFHTLGMMNDAEDAEYRKDFESDPTVELMTGADALLDIRAVKALDAGARPGSDYQAGEPQKFVDGAQKLLDILDSGDAEPKRIKTGVISSEENPLWKPYSEMVQSVEELKTAADEGVAPSVKETEAYYKKLTKVYNAINHYQLAKEKAGEKDDDYYNTSKELKTALLKEDTRVYDLSQRLGKLGDKEKTIRERVRKDRMRESVERSRIREEMRKAKLKQALEERKKNPPKELTEDEREKLRAAINAKAAAASEVRERAEKERQARDPKFIDAQKALEEQERREKELEEKEKQERREAEAKSMKEVKAATAPLNTEKPRQDFTATAHRPSLDDDVVVVDRAEERQQKLEVAHEKMRDKEAWEQIGTLRQFRQEALRSVNDLEGVSKLNIFQRSSRQFEDMKKAAEEFWIDTHSRRFNGVSESKAPTDEELMHLRECITAYREKVQDYLDYKGYKPENKAKVSNRRVLAAAGIAENLDKKLAALNRYLKPLDEQKEQQMQQQMEEAEKKAEEEYDKRWMLATRISRQLMHNALVGVKGDLTEEKINKLLTDDKVTQQASMLMNSSAFSRLVNHLSQPREGQPTKLDELYAKFKADPECKNQDASKEATFGFVNEMQTIKAEDLARGRQLAAPMAVRVEQAKMDVKVSPSLDRK